MKFPIISNKVWHYDKTYKLNIYRNTKHVTHWSAFGSDCISESCFPKMSKHCFLSRYVGARCAFIDPDQCRRFGIRLCLRCIYCKQSCICGGEHVNKSINQRHHTWIKLLTGYFTTVSLFFKVKRVISILVCVVSMMFWLIAHNTWRWHFQWHNYVCWMATPIWYSPGGFNN